MRTRLPRALLPRLLRWRANVYPPYLFAGVHVTRVAADFSRLEVELRDRPWNRNYVGTHFGGSLFAMADPWFMLMLLERLGRGYVVWDKAATIRFRKPGRGTVRAVFELPAERVAAIRREADAEGKAQPTFSVDLVDRDGEVVATVEKVVSVRRKA